MGRYTLRRNSNTRNLSNPGKLTVGASNWNTSFILLQKMNEIDEHLTENERELEPAN